MLHTNPTYKNERKGLKRAEAHDRRAREEEKISRTTPMGIFAYERVKNRLELNGYTLVTTPSKFQILENAQLLEEFDTIEELEQYLDSATKWREDTQSK